MKFTCLALLVFLAGCGLGPDNPLNSAASRNDVQQIQDLLEHHESVNAPGGHGVVPLASAARAGAVDAIAVLIKNGADPNLRSGVNGWTPLVHAIHKNQPKSVEALLKNGADANARSGSGQTALMMAAGYGFLDIVNILLAHGADPRVQTSGGETALDWAVLGVSDIDRFTMGDCQLPTARALIAKAPDLKLRDTVAIRRVVEVAKLKGCAAMSVLFNGH